MADKSPSALNDEAPGDQQRAASPSVAVYRTVYDELHERIRSGAWQAGDRLPSISQLAREFEVSTGSVREALRSLQSIGSVSIEHGRGVFVAGGAAIAGLGEDVYDLARDDATPIHVLVALAETRRILEPELVALAAERGADEEMAEIDRLAKAMELQAGKGEDFAEPDMQFHRLIAEAARNPVLFRMVESVNGLLRESRALTAREPGMTARAVRYHLLIGEALLERNAAQAKLLMLAHMNDALGSLLAVAARLNGRAG